jgi:hypothetical protein
MLCRLLQSPAGFPAEETCQQPPWKSYQINRHQVAWCLAGARNIRPRAPPLPAGILLPLPRFSKFLHGVGALFQREVEQLPNWFLPDESDPSLMTPATWEEMADTSDAHLKVRLPKVMRTSR